MWKEHSWGNFAAIHNIEKTTLAEQIGQHTDDRLSATLPVVNWCNWLPWSQQKPLCHLKPKMFALHTGTCSISVYFCNNFNPKINFATAESRLGGWVWWTTGKSDHLFSFNALDITALTHNHPLSVPQQKCLAGRRFDIIARQLPHTWHWPSDTHFTHLSLRVFFFHWT